MQVDVKDFLRLVEAQKTLMFWDSESQGLNGDYGPIHVVSIKSYGQRPVAYAVKQLGNDRAIVRQAKEHLERADAWVTYYGKGHDVLLLNTRLLRHGLEPVTPRPHIDLYFSLKFRLKMARRSQAHMLEFLEDTMKQYGVEPAKKMTVSPNVWADIGHNFDRNIKILIERCNSDTVGLEALYGCTKQLIRDISR